MNGRHTVVKIPYTVIPFVFHPAGSNKTVAWRELELLCQLVKQVVERLKRDWAVGDGIKDSMILSEYE